jgi:hypothetical protein
MICPFARGGLTNGLSLANAQADSRAFQIDAGLTFGYKGTVRVLFPRIPPMNNLSKRDAIVAVLVLCMVAAILSPIWRRESITGREVTSDKLDSMKVINSAPKAILPSKSNPDWPFARQADGSALLEWPGGEVTPAFFHPAPASFLSPGLPPYTAPKIVLCDAEGNIVYVRNTPNRLWHTQADPYKALTNRVWPKILGDRWHDMQPPKILPGKLSPQRFAALYSAPHYGQWRYSSFLDSEYEAWMVTLVGEFPDWAPPLEIAVLDVSCDGDRAGDGRPSLTRYLREPLRNYGLRAWPIEGWEQTMKEAKFTEFALWFECGALVDEEWVNPLIDTTDKLWSELWTVPTHEKSAFAWERLKSLNKMADLNHGTVLFVNSHLDPNQMDKLIASSSGEQRELYQTIKKQFAYFWAHTAEKNEWEEAERLRREKEREEQRTKFTDFEPGGDTGDPFKR